MVLHDVATLTFFNALLEDMMRLLRSLVPGDQLLAFCMSLIVFVVAKQRLPPEKNTDNSH